MSLILCIETGTDICSAALSKNGKMIALRESNEGRDHARRVGVFVNELLKENSLDSAELDAVAVGKGPGSYTGLRIGVAFAKGLCYGIQKPLIAIDSLKSLASCAVEEYQMGIIDVEDWGQARLCPMIDARRMEVYAEVFDTDLNSLSEVEAHIISPESFAEFITPKSEFLIFGNGAEKCVEILNNQQVKYLKIDSSARGLCQIAQQKFDKTEFEDIAYFEPFYLKDFIVIKSKKKIF